MRTKERRGVIEMIIRDKKAGARTCFFGIEALSELNCDQPPRHLIFDFLSASPTDQNVVEV